MRANTISNINDTDYGTPTAAVARLIDRERATMLCGPPAILDRLFAGDYEFGPGRIDCDARADVHGKFRHAASKGPGRSRGR